MACRRSCTATTTVPLNVAVPATGSYTLNAASLLNFGASTKVYLLDTQTGARIDLAQQPAYTFTTQRHGHARPLQPVLRPGRLRWPPTPRPWPSRCSYSRTRHTGSFTLMLPAELGRTPVTAVLYNQLGQAVLKQTVTMTAAGATAQFDVSRLALGVYTLRLGSGDTQVTKRVVVE